MLTINSQVDILWLQRHSGYVSTIFTSCNKVDRLQEHSTTLLLPLFYYRAKLDNEQYHWQDTLKNDFKKRLLQNMWPWLK